eukprot:CAMPEP_0196584310 /NCGR_PEP_ID=MMETSP1081-20130531/46628_1 /TAXON_ID=36882 /ORGANISM="Pyramimonas amylifera, Strain CCMP720" /LENGTH=152 /DNA_ID=CAMNT_0041905477 /DNA_START=113 /DNA_END=572 /DNA_ORIENTATION=+
MPRAPAVDELHSQLGPQMSQQSGSALQGSSTATGKVKMTARPRATAKRATTPPASSSSTALKEVVDLTDSPPRSRSLPSSPRVSDDCIEIISPSPLKMKMGHDASLLLSERQKKARMKKPPLCTARSALKTLLTLGAHLADIYSANNVLQNV